MRNQQLRVAMHSGKINERHSNETADQDADSQRGEGDVSVPAPGNGVIGHRWGLFSVVVFAHRAFRTG